jgi:hypothetical protein
MLKLTKKWSLFLMIAVLFTASVYFSSCGDDKKEVQTQSQTEPTPENPSKRPGSVSMDKENLVLKKGNDFFIATEIIEQIDNFDPNKPVYFACGESPKDDGNGWLCDPRKKASWDRYIMTKKDDGYYLPFIPNHEGNPAQLSGSSTGDPDQDINWCMIDRYKSAPWIHIEISTGRVAIDPIKAKKI